MKRKVALEYMNDMKRYIKDINPDDYKITYDETDSTIIEYARDYYSNHLPVDLITWMRVNIPDENLKYKKEFKNQTSFILNVILPMFYDFITTKNKESYEEFERKIEVISTFHSKSILFPVYKIFLDKINVTIIMKNNTYEWKVSIDSKYPIKLINMDIFDSKMEINKSIRDDIPKEKVFDCYDKNHNQFTLILNNNYKVYTFFNMFAYMQKQ